MVTKLAPAHRTRDGQPIKTTDIARTRPRTGDRVPAPAHAGDRPGKRARTGDRVPAPACSRRWPACICEED